MTLAVHADVELFRYVGHEKQLHQETIAFSVSHDHSKLRIYSHYAVMNGPEQKYYLHTIPQFDVTTLDGKEQWTAYKFVNHFYEIWMPDLFKRIFSAIDSFPLDVSVNLSQQPELPFTEQSGLLHDFSIYNMVQLIVGSWSAQGKADDQSTTSNEKPPT